jgi:hypothetical protein
MVFPIAGGTQDTGYEISNSLRFNDDDGAYLQRTAGANTGEDNATLSFWFKLGNIKSDNNGGTIMTEGGTTGNHVMQIYANKIYIGSGAFGIMFPNLIRDPSAWYHLFVAFDTSQSTNTNRVKAYLNGVLLTDATGFTDYPDQNENLGLCVNGNTTRVGSRGNTGAQAFDGYLAEFHFLDGTTKAYTDFGEFNDNGVWIPKKYTGGSYGDNGFYLEFKQTGTSADASGIGADTSGEGHHFSVSSVVATDVTEDTPTNNFATMNSVASIATLSEGNCKVVTTNGQRMAGASTIGFENGKWYMEYKVTDINSTNMTIGIDNENGLSFSDFRDNDDFWNASNAYAYENNGNKRTTSVNSSYGNSYTTGDIIGVAVDMDNRKIYFSKNGTYQNSGDPTTGSTGTGSAFDLTDGLTYFFQAADNDSASGVTLEANFGNPSFSISSGNSDGKYGNFEYAPPSGYYALCTKRLAEFG